MGSPDGRRRGGRLAGQGRFQQGSTDDRGQGQRRGNRRPTPGPVRCYARSHRHETPLTSVQGTGGTTPGGDRPAQRESYVRRAPALTPSGLHPVTLPRRTMRTSGLIFVLSSCLLAAGGATGACRDAGAGAPAHRRHRPAGRRPPGRGHGRAGRHVRRACSIGTRWRPTIARPFLDVVEPAFSSRKLRAHHAYSLTLGPDFRVRELTYRIDPDRFLQVLPAFAAGRGRPLRRGSPPSRDLPPRGRRWSPSAATSIASTRRSSPRSSGPARTSAWRSGSPSCSAATSISTATCSPATSSKSCSSRCCGTGRASATATSSRRGSPTPDGCSARSASSRPAGSPPTTTPPGCR